MMYAIIKPMPIRSIPFVNNEIYHVCNRSISRTPVFISKRDYKRALRLLRYYRFVTPFSFSKLERLPLAERSALLERLDNEDTYRAKVLCFCLMPNHFHLLLKQVKEEGISKFIADFQNSYTRYSNLRNGRVGPLFRGPFKAVRVETEPQLLHLSRYIHLNPYSSLIVKDRKKLEEYPWSSLREYLSPERKGICNIEQILNCFNSPGEYKKFVFDRADYQRELEAIKHLILETS